MPLYDFECPHGHRFEKMVSMDRCGDPIPCEGKVPQIQLATSDGGDELPVVMVPCALQAATVISHSNPAGSLDHGSSNNRDAAREGRYDPLNPSRRFMAKGRGYRK